MALLAVRLPWKLSNQVLPPTLFKNVLQLLGSVPDTSMHHPSLRVDARQKPAGNVVGLAIHCLSDEPFKEDPLNIVVGRANTLHQRNAVTSHAWAPRNLLAGFCWSCTAWPTRALFEGPVQRELKVSSFSRKLHLL